MEGRNLIYHFDLWTTKANFAVECIHRRTPQLDKMLGKDKMESKGLQRKDIASFTCIR